MKKAFFIILICLNIFIFHSIISFAQEEASAESDVTPTKYYTIDKSVTMEIFPLNSSEDIAVFGKIINADVNNDGRCTVSDARKVLRCSASLEEIDNIAMADVNENGRVDASDARIILRYVTLLDTHYICENNTKPNGMYTDKSGKTLCFNDGILCKDISTFDGKKYLFSKEGYLIKNGTAVVNGKTYKSDNSGVLRNGFYSENGKKYYLNNGEVIKGNFYYGYDLYYSKNDGSLATNETIGYFAYNANGVASTKTIDKNTLSWHIKQIIKKTGTDPYSIFKYVASSANFSYKIMSPDTPDNMVLQMLRYHRGSCYQYTYLTKYLYDAAGYETVVVKGVGMTGTGDHWWLMVKINGKWYHIDTEYPRSSGGTYMKTSAQMKRLGYRWNEANYPATQ